MNQYLAYQFVGRSDGLQKLPNHIQQIKQRLGVEERERQVVEELVPQLRRRIRAQSIPDKAVPKQILLTNLAKRLSTLRQEYDRIGWELQKFQTFRNTIRNPKTVFEQHFQQIESQIFQMEEQRGKLQTQIKQIRKEMFILENESFTGKKIATNQSVLLSDLVTIEKKLPSPKQLPKLEKRNSSLNNETAQNMIDFLESEEDEDEYRPRTRQNKKLPTLEHLMDQLDHFVVRSSDKLKPSKELLREFRLGKYEKYLRIVKNTRRIKNIRYCFITVVFCFCLIKATQISQQRYQLISQQFQRQNFDRHNQEVLFFVNNIIAKQILFQFNRLQQLQKAEKKKNKIHLPFIAEDIVREIIVKLGSQKFSNNFYHFLSSVSEKGFYPLQNYHSEFIRSKMIFSKYFNYLLKDAKKLVFQEVVIMKSIIYYGLFSKAKELFAQLKIDIDSEFIYTVAIMLIELLLRNHQQTATKVNLKSLAPPAEAQQIISQLRELDQVKMKLMINLQVDELQRPFQLMVERQLQYFNEL